MQNMGLGILSSNNVIIKRKYRWTAEIQQRTGGVIVSPKFVKVSARPNLNIEETTTDFLNNKAWIPNKANYEELTLTYYDLNNLDELYKYAQECHLTPTRADYYLTLYDGCGFCVEEWKLHNGFMTEINFSQLDFSSSECTDIEIKVRYEKAEYRSATTSKIKPDLIYNNYQGFSIPAQPFVMPEVWKIVNPIPTESSSPGAKILDQFLRRTASK